MLTCGVLLLYFVSLARSFDILSLSRHLQSNMREVVEIANEMHVGPWYEMLSRSTPPIQNTPLSPTLPDLILRKNRCHLDPAKMTRITGWKPKFPRVTADEVKRTMDTFIQDGVWPVVPPRKAK